MTQVANPQATKTDPSQADRQKFIDYRLRKLLIDPWNENGECWATGEGLEPVEFPLMPRWNGPDRGKD